MGKGFREIFIFSKKERVAIYLLLIISSLVWVIPGFFSVKKIDPEWITITPLELSERKKQFLNRTDCTYKTSNRRYENTEFSKTPMLFQFDPNEVSREELIKLGFTERIASSLINYRLKGGHFKSADDLKKIYGLNPDLANRLIPYAVVKTASNATPFQKQKDAPSSTPAMLDINHADSTAFASLPGIGSRLSSRIVRYRQRLGGFYDLNQLKEVYGITDSTLKQIRGMLYNKGDGINKLNLNEMKYEELSSHPYIGYSKARLLIAFRNTHGKIKNRDELMRAALFDSIVVEKILPYCLF